MISFLPDHNDFPSLEGVKEDSYSELVIKELMSELRTANQKIFTMKVGLLVCWIVSASVASILTIHSEHNRAIKAGAGQYVGNSTESKHFEYNQPIK